MIKDQFYFGRGAAGTGVAAIWATQHPHTGALTTHAESWFCPRNGTKSTGRRLRITPGWGSYLGNLSPFSALLDIVKAWMDGQAWVLAPSSARFSDGLGAPVEDLERLKAELFHLGVECPDLLGFMADTTKKAGLREHCYEAKEACELVKLEPLAPS